MGTTYTFSCPQCKYKSHVSGGRDCGMICATRTMTCITCNKLVDVVTMENDRTYSKKDPIFHPECPKCHGTSLKIWPSRLRPCPKCGTKMIKEPGEYIFWD